MLDKRWRNPQWRRFLGESALLALHCPPLHGVSQLTTTLWYDVEYDYCGGADDPTVAYPGLVEPPPARNATGFAGRWRMSAFPASHTIVITWERENASDREDGSCTI